MNVDNRTRTMAGQPNVKYIILNRLIKNLKIPRQYSHIIFEVGDTQQSNLVLISDQCGDPRCLGLRAADPGSVALNRVSRPRDSLPAGFQRLKCFRIVGEPLPVSTEARDSYGFEHGRTCFRLRGTFT